ncbi:unnamed protein product [Cyclocybe aegerita]|uniref:Uncharacterized protein n=1 Tax=Cyclocybe aegerita TaxID=1973307 RepID=A0A8S0VT58_CYCAE|nr:unnamed protein product [Cyclocybe aegerita]
MLYLLRASPAPRVRVCVSIDAVLQLPFGIAIVIEVIKVLNLLQLLKLLKAQHHLLPVPHALLLRRGPPQPQLYSGTFPAMIPIFLLGSAVYLGLELTQLKLAHEKYMEESEKEVMALEAEIDALQDARVNVQAQASNPPISPAISPSASGDPASSPTPRSRWRFW